MRCTCSAPPSRPWCPISTRDHVGAPLEHVLYVTASERRRNEARTLRLRAVALAEVANALDAWRPEVRALGVANLVPIELQAAVAA